MVRLGHVTVVHPLADLQAENKLLIVSLGGLEPLIRQMLSPNVEVQCNAVGCVTNLATHGQFFLSCWLPEACAHPQMKTRLLSPSLGRWFRSPAWPSQRTCACNATLLGLS